MLPFAAALSSMATNRMCRLVAGSPAVRTPDRSVTIVPSTRPTIIRWSGSSGAAEIESAVVCAAKWQWKSQFPG